MMMILLLLFHFLLLLFIVVVMRFMMMFIVVIATVMMIFFVTMIVVTMFMIMIVIVMMIGAVFIVTTRRTRIVGIRFVFFVEKLGIRCQHVVDVERVDAENSVERNRLLAQIGTNDRRYRVDLTQSMLDILQLTLRNLFRIS